MKKRLFVPFLLLCVLAIVFVGCGGRRHAQEQIELATYTPPANPGRCIPPATPVPDLLPEAVPAWYYFCHCNLEPDQLRTDADYEAVTHLEIHFNAEYDLSIRDLTVFPNLVKLKIGNAQLRDLEKLADFAHLAELEIQYCTLENLDAIGEMEHLRMLTLSRNNLVSLDGLEKLAGLEHLDVSYNSIESLVPLHGMKIRSLNVQNNPIAALDDIAEIENLEILNISNCPINSLEELVELEHLLHLNMWLSDAKLDLLESMEPLSRMAALEGITIHPQRISLLRHVRGKGELMVYFTTDPLFASGRTLDEIFAQQMDV